MTQTTTIPSSIIGIMEGFVMLFVVLSYFVQNKVVLAQRKRSLAKGEERA